MMMFVDISRAEKSFDDMARESSEVGESIGVSLRCHREVFLTSMHWI